MLDRLFPPQTNSTYRGHVLAIWLLWPVVIFKLVMGFNVAGFNPWVSSRYIIEHADGVPIDTYPTHAAAMTLFLFSSWGVALLALALMGVVVLVRYRAMLPLMFVALTLEQVGRRFLAMEHLGGGIFGRELTFAVAINWGFTIFLLLGFALSLTLGKRRS